MAYSIEDSAKIVLELLSKNDVIIEYDEKLKFKDSGEAIIYGYLCKIVNVLSLHSCRILVNTSLFSPKDANYSKPHMIRGYGNHGIDYQLIPTKNKLYAIHFLDLRQYALFLEKERSHWFKQSYWGIQINENSNTFSWEGGNTIQFPLKELFKASNLKEIYDELLKTIR